jgi:hypothetical protein
VKFAAIVDNNAKLIISEDREISEQLRGLTKGFVLVACHVIFFTGDHLTLIITESGKIWLTIVM